MKTKIKFILCLAALMVALSYTFSCSKGGKQPVEKQAVAIDTTNSLRTDSVNPEWNAKLDSLLLVAATAKQDTNLAKLYYDIGDMYHDNNLPKAKEYYFKLRTLSDNLNWNEGRYKFVASFTDLLNREGLMDSAIVIHRQALELAKSENNELRIAKISANLGNCYFYKQWYETALTYYNEALPLFEKRSDKFLVAYINELMAVVYEHLKMKDECGRYYEKALNIFNEVPDTINRADLLINYANSLTDKREYEKAEKFALEAQRIFILHNSQYGLMSVYGNLLTIAIHKLDLEKMEFYSNRLLKIALKFGSVDRYCAVNRVLSFVQMYKGNYNKSEEYARLALDTAVRYDLTDEQMKCYILISDLSIARHNFHNYRLYYFKYDSIQTLVMSEKTQRYAKEMQAKYETEKKELEIAQQKQIIKNQNLQHGLLAGGIAVSIVILALLWYMLRLRNRRNHALTERNDALAEMNATKDKFFSIISHDLKNPAVAQCDALRAMIENAGLWDADTITDYYHELLKSAEGQVELLYNLLNWAQIQTGRMTYTPDRFTLSDLLSDITLIRNMAKNKGVALVLPQSQVALITGDRNMLSTVVRNLLTNAVKFTPAGGTVTLDISGAHTGAPLQYTISVSDTGVGMTKEQIANLFRLDSADSSIGTAGERGSGLGLIVCKELLEKHGSELHVESEVGKGSRFWFTISA